MLKNDLKRLKDIQEILSKLDKNTAQNVIKELYEDFYFFATEVLDSIKLKQVQAYDLSDLKTLEELDKKYDYDIKPKVTNLIKPAENNTKVLKLAKDLNRLK